MAEFAFGGNNYACVVRPKCVTIILTIHTMLKPISLFTVVIIVLLIGRDKAL